MTYRRKAGSFHAALSRAVADLGEAAVARLWGVTGSRVRQMANPMGGQLHLLDKMAALDAAAAAAGYGTPIHDAYRARLVAGGAVRVDAGERRAARLAAAIRTALAMLAAALDAGGEIGEAA